MSVEIKIQFNKFYEGGEDTPPILELDFEEIHTRPCVPEHSDTITRLDGEYFVYDVKHNFNGAVWGVDHYDVLVIATRRVKYHELDNQPKRKPLHLGSK